jgi:hypothetical protein
MTQEVCVFKAEFAPDSIHLIHEESEPPHFRIVGTVRVSAAKLVIQDNRATSVGEALQRL